MFIPHQHPPAGSTLTCEKPHCATIQATCLPVPAGNVNRSPLQQHRRLRKRSWKVKDGVERAECSLGKSATLLSKTATFILVQAENIIHKKCHLVFVTSIQFFVLSDCRSIAKAYILFLAFQDKLLSEGHYYVFLKEEQRRPSKCFTILSWGGWTGNSLFQGFPRAFLGLEQAGFPHL